MNEAPGADKKGLGAERAAFLSRTLLDRLGSIASLDDLTPFPVAGTYLFCDVSGFTQLSEALMKMGREGSEELTRILNRYFERMIRIIVAMGGDTLTFGGDAMTVLFPDGEKHPASSAHRASVAAWHMMDAMEEFADLKAGRDRVSLAMKIGAARGTALFGVLGDDRRGRSTYVAGEPLDGSADSEHHAEKGHIVLRADVAGLLGEDYTRVPAGEGFFRLTAIPTGGSVPLFAPKPDGPAFAAGIIPQHIRDKLAADQRITSGEHRTAVILFVQFAGIRYEEAVPAHEALSRFYAVLAETTARYGGSINKVDMGDKGSKAILVFGAPNAIENAEEMGARCALEILQDAGLKDLLTGLRIGISKGSIFAGFVGSPLRREYTVMGDAVNLSARLMAASQPFSALANDLVYARAPGVRFEVLEPITVKGKSMPIPIARPLDVQEVAPPSATLAAEPFVGRDGARAGAEDAVAHGTGFAFLGGEAGIGKSLLLGRLAAEDPARRLIRLASFQRHAFFSALRPLFRDLLGVTSGLPPVAVQERVQEALGPDRDWAKLFRDVLGMDMPADPVVDAMPARDRKDLFLAVARRFLQRALPAAHRALLIDQCEHLDDASAEILASCANDPAGAGIPVLMAGRSQALRGASPAELKLDGWSGEDIARWLAEVWNWSAAPSDLVEVLASRARGNPLFTAQLMGALCDAGIVVGDRTRGWAYRAELLATAALPEGLEALLLARMDRLPEELKAVTRICAVAGSSFPGDLVAPIIAGDAAHALDALVGEEILARAGATLEFSNSLFRDAVYDSLNFSERRRLHGEVASALEASTPDHNRIIGILAHHWFESGNADKAAPILERAADEAMRRFALPAAWEHLKKLESLLDQPGQETRRAQCCLRRAEVGRDLGLARDVLPDLGVARALLSGEEAARALYLMAELSRMTGDIPGMMGLLASSDPGSVRDPDLRAYAMNQAGIAAAMSGEIERSDQCFQEAGVAADLAGNVAVLAGALSNRANLAMMSGRSSDAESSYRRALALASERKLFKRVGDISANLGSLHEYRSDIVGFRKYSLLSLHAYETAGQTSAGRVALAACAYAASRLGRPAEAVPALRSVCAFFANAGMTRERLMATRQLFEALHLNGQTADAWELATYLLEAVPKVDLSEQYKLEFQALLLVFGYLRPAGSVFDAGACAPGSTLAELADLLRGRRTPGLSEWIERVARYGADEAVCYWVLLAPRFVTEPWTAEGREALAHLHGVVRGNSDRWKQALYLWVRHAARESLPPLPPREALWGDRIRRRTRFRCLESPHA